MRKAGIVADAALNATGLNNLRSGSVWEDDNDKDEFGPDEFVDVDGEEGDEFVSIENEDEEEPAIAEAEESDSAGSASESEADETDNVVDQVTSETIAEVQAETAKNIANLEKKEGEGMRKYPIKFFDTIRDQAYAAINDGKLSEELQGFVMDIIRNYPEVRAQAAGWIDAYEAENKIPSHGWRYKAVGILNGKIFDSKKEAEKAAADFIGLGHKFEELFIADLFYKNEDGSFGERIPDDSRHRELIMEKLASGQQSNNAG